ncbi:MAG TPA: SDR family NAD(P)-dependent oxidoreductase [Acidimicrobiales bacterium]|jgi:3-oxoacyl-[acyl-carrier protein] reductase|nr:SDR family NAD(P)-dependent oxidoreductase [Acidimicrobiales bacterium]
MSKENQPLAGKVALVTGTTQGIGRGIAEALTAEGATVHGIDKDTVDVTDSKAVNAFVASIGGADILVNSAGGVRGQIGKPIEEVTDEQWRDVVESNLTGAFICVRAVVPSMKERGWGRIVTISSGAGRSVSLTGIQAYASAKAAQIGFTRQMAHELGRFGITVNCVAPGFVLSNPTSIAQWESYGDEGQQKLLDAIPTRRLGTAEDIANGVRFFVSPDSSWISGQTLSVDGGHALY